VRAWVLLGLRVGLGLVGLALRSDVEMLLKALDDERARRIAAQLRAELATEEAFKRLSQGLRTQPGGMS
jgi:hypothetical protein